MELHVDLGQLSSLAKELDIQGHAIESELEQLNSSSNALSAAWSGEAERAYRRSYSRVRSHSNQVISQLRKTSATLRRVADGYSELDRVAAESVKLN